MNLNILLFLSVLQGIILFGHFAVYRTFVKFFPGIQGSASVKIVLLFLSFSFLIFSALCARWYNPVLSALYYGSAVWMGTLHLLVWASILLWAIYLPARLAGFSLPMEMLAKGFFVLAVGLSFYGLLHSYQTKVVKYEVTLPNLPDYWQEKNLVLVADTHFGNIRNLGFSKKIAQLIEQQHPEAVLIAGDFFDGPPMDFLKVAEPFGKISAPSGVYFSSGNHEEYTQLAYYEAIEKAGMYNLTGSLMVVNGLQILGVPYFGTGSDLGLKTSLDSLNIEPKKPAVLIKHAPNALGAAEQAGVNLTVSGHSHKGQVWPGMLLTKKIFGGFDYGLNYVGKMAQITTSGAGTWGPPQRLGTNSEIVVITFKK